MNKKGLLLLVIIVILLTGCSRIDDDIDHVVSSIMGSKVNKVNVVSTGYQLYIPMGVMQLDDNEYNQKLKIRDTHVYLYVDIVSYFYKNSLNYVDEEEYNYFYKDILLNDRTGYIGINKLEDDNYFVKIVYNYSKIEFYANKYDLSFITANSLIILNSIKYNDNLIKMELSTDYSAFGEIEYELDKPEGSKSTFSQYLEEYVETVEDTVLPDGE